MGSWHVRAVVWKWLGAGVVDEVGAELLGGGAMVEPGKCGGSQWRRATQRSGYFCR